MHKGADLAGLHYRGVKGPPLNEVARLAAMADADRARTTTATRMKAEAKEREMARDGRGINGSLALAAYHDRPGAR